MQILKIRAVPRTAHGAFRVHAGRRLDLDDIGPEIGELPHAGGAGAHAREIEDAETRECGRGWDVRHAVSVIADERERYDNLSKGR